MRALARLRAISLLRLNHLRADLSRGEEAVFHFQLPWNLFRPMSSLDVEASNRIDISLL